MDVTKLWNIPSINISFIVSIVAQTIERFPKQLTIFTTKRTTKLLSYIVTVILKKLTSCKRPNILRMLYITKMTLVTHLLDTCHDSNFVNSILQILLKANLHPKCASNLRIYTWNGIGYTYKLYMSETILCESCNVILKQSTYRL